MVVVESLAHALARGATPIAEVIGGALTADAFHISAPEPTGRGQARAMTKALRNAGVAPDEIDYIVAHGTSTPLNDVTETRAIKAAYGDARLQGRDQLAEVDDRPPRRRGRDRRRRSPAIGAIRDQVIPPTANLHTPDPECDLDYVPLDGAPGEDRHGRGQRLRLRRPERGRDLPPRSAPRAGRSGSTAASVAEPRPRTPRSARPAPGARPSAAPSRSRTGRSRSRRSPTSASRTVAVAAVSRCSSAKLVRPIRVARVSTVTVSPKKHRRPERDPRSRRGSGPRPGRPRG